MIYLIYIALITYVVLVYPRLDKIYSIKNFNGKISKGDFVYVAIGIAISSSIPYWLDSSKLLSGLGYNNFFKYLLTTIFFYIALTYSSNIKNKIASRAFLYFIYSIFTALIILRCFSTGIGFNIDPFYQWHHYSAYVGQAELLMAGVLPYNDIPLQYGLGPVLITLAGCKINCWESLHFFVVIISILQTLLLFYVTLRIVPSRNPLYISVVLLIIFITSLFYPFYQFTIYPVTTIPSVYALRFFPSLIMFFILLCQSGENSHHLGKTKLQILLIYIYWVFCIFWSPEAGIQSGILFFSYLFWRDRKIESGATSFIKLIFSYVVIIVAMTCSAFAILGLIFYFFTGEALNIATYFSYLIYPPVEIAKVNLKGPLWFIVSILVLWLAWSHSVKNNKYSVWLVLVMCLSFSTYYLAHKSDLVIFALMPYFTILLITINYHAYQKPIKIISAVMISSLMGWSTLFLGWNEFKASLLNGDYFLINMDFKESHKLSKIFSRSYNQPFLNQTLRPEIYVDTLHVRQALEYIHSNFHEPVEIYDWLSILDSEEPYAPWNAFHGPINYWSIPPTYRKYYLLNVAKRLNRSGWILYKNDIDMQTFLLDYSSAYLIDKKIEFGNYTAIRYTPLILNKF